MKGEKYLTPNYCYTALCQDLNSLISPGTVPRPPITFRLVVPASQCGSLIGQYRT